MNKRAKSILAYGLLATVIVLSVVLLAQIVIAYTSGDSDLGIEYRLVEKDMAGRHYTPNCLTDCHLPFCVSYMGGTTPSSLDVNKQDVKQYFNFLEGVDQSRLKDYGIDYLITEIYYVDVPDYGTCEGKRERYDNSTNESLGYETYEYSCIIGSHQEQRTKQVWRPLKDISQIEFEKDKERCFDIWGKLELRFREKFAVDVIPSIKFLGEEFIMTEMAWWNSSNVDYKKEVSINQTGTTTIANFTYIINNSAIFNSTWAIGKVLGLLPGDTNSTHYLYYNSESDFYLVNGSEDTQLAVDVISGPGTNDSQTDVYLPDGMLFLPFPEFPEPGGPNTEVTYGDKTHDRTTHASHGIFQVQGTGNPKGGINKTNDSIVGPYAFDFYTATDVGAPGAAIFGNIPKINNEITVVAWIKTSGGGNANGGVVSDAGPSYSVVWSLGRDSSGYTLYWDYTDCGNVRATTGSFLGIEDGEWHMLVGRYNKTGIAVFVDGKENNSVACSNSVIASTGTYWIGTKQTAGENYTFKGTIDGVAVYNTSKSDNWILAQYEFYKYGYSSMGAEETESGGGDATESQGDSAIQAGIASSVINASQTNYSDQQVYAVNVSGDQVLGKFDVLVSSGDQRWAFNYVTSGDSTSSYTYMMNITPVLYVWEAANKTEAEITSEVQVFIDGTQ